MISSVFLSLYFIPMNITSIFILKVSLGFFFIGFQIIYLIPKIYKYLDLSVKGEFMN